MNQGQSNENNNDLYKTVTEIGLDNIANQKPILKSASKVNNDYEHLKGMFEIPEFVATILNVQRLGIKYETLNEKTARLTIGNYDDEKKEIKFHGSMNIDTNSELNIEEAYEFLMLECGNVCKPKGLKRITLMVGNEVVKEGETKTNLITKIKEGYNSFMSSVYGGRK